MTETADCVVIGAGIIGSSIALELAASGLRVLVVDAQGGPGQASTSASSAVVRFNYSTLDGVALSWESQHCWSNWSDHLKPQPGEQLARFHRIGKIFLDVDVAPRSGMISLFKQARIPHEEWDPEVLRSRIPGIDTGRYWPPKSPDNDDFWAEPTGEIGGLFTPDAGFIDDAQLAAVNLSDAARRQGARYVFHRTVVTIRSDGDRVTGMQLDDGRRFDAPVVVNAAGPWSGAVNRLAGVGEDFTIALRPLRQEVHHVPAPPGYNPAGGLGPVIADLDLGTYMRPTPSGGFLIGGTEPDCDPLEWVDDLATVNPYPTADVYEAQVTRAARRLTQLRVPPTPVGIAGVYDVSSDWAPIYDRTSLSGFYVAVGTSGNQFKNAPVVGKLLASLITAVESGLDHDATPLRYVGEHTGLTINLGSFSRRRQINAESSGTVMG